MLTYNAYTTGIIKGNVIKCFALDNTLINF